MLHRFMRKHALRGNMITVLLVEDLAVGIGLRTRLGAELSVAVVSKVTDSKTAIRNVTRTASATYLQAMKGEPI